MREWGFKLGSQDAALQRGKINERNPARIGAYLVVLRATDEKGAVRRKCRRADK